MQRAYMRWKRRRMLCTPKHTPRSGGGGQGARAHLSREGACNALTSGADDTHLSHQIGAHAPSRLKAYHVTARHIWPDRLAQQEKKQPSEELQNAACLPITGRPSQAHAGPPDSQALRRDAPRRPGGCGRTPGVAREGRQAGIAICLRGI